MRGEQARPDDIDLEDIDIRGLSRHDLQVEREAIGDSGDHREYTASLRAGAISSGYARRRIRSSGHCRTMPTADGLSGHSKGVTYPIVARCLRADLHAIRPIALM